MISIDDRAGSRDLYPHLPASHSRLVRLDFGDVAIVGSGPDGAATLDIGYEVKSIPDLVACIHNGRFAGHQLPGMLREYDLAYLLVLNRIRADHTDTLYYHAGAGKWYKPFGGQRHQLTYTALRKWLLTIEVQGGIRVILCDGLKDAAHLILSHYRWWSDDWDSHKSLKTFNDSRTFSPFSQPTTLRKMAAQLRSISWTRSRAVEKHFASVRDMVAATVEDWQQVEGIGPKIARTVVDEIGRDGIGTHKATDDSSDKQQLRRRAVRRKIRRK